MTPTTCDPTSPDRRSPDRPAGTGDAGAYDGRGEPTLPELMDDPVLRRLMASDGVRPDALLALIADTRLRLAAG